VTEGPHHFKKHSDCSFTFEEGPGPDEVLQHDNEAMAEALEDIARLVGVDTSERLVLDEIVRGVELFVDAQQTDAKVEADMWRDAHQRMKENFLNALGTIRKLEDELHRAKQATPRDEVLANFDRLIASAKAGMCKACGGSGTHLLESDGWKGRVKCLNCDGTGIG
jgi:hypothetical protein